MRGTGGESTDIAAGRRSRAGAKHREPGAGQIPSVDRGHPGVHPCGQTDAQPLLDGEACTPTEPRTLLIDTSSMHEDTCFVNQAISE